MSEKNVKNQAAPKESTTKENKETKKETTKGREVAKVTKAEWTVDRCKRYARRFPNESVWASASPASYKAAIAHGWKEECLKAMMENTTHKSAA